LVKEEKYALRRTKNKLQKPVLFPAPKKATVNSPRLPRTPPQIHDKSTTRCTHFFAKTLQKPHSTTPEKPTEIRAE
jgi:hypothetical protein